MGHSVVRFLAALVAVVAIVLGLKLFGLGPDEVLRPRDHAELDTPFGSFFVGTGRRPWVGPLLLVHVLSVPALWRLCGRLGHPGWFALATLVPLANVLLLYLLAFAGRPADARPAVAAATRDDG